MEIPNYLTCLLRNLYAGREATLRTGHETANQERSMSRLYIVPTLAWGRLCCRLQWQLPTSKQPGHVVDLFHYGQVFFLCLLLLFQGEHLFHSIWRSWHFGPKVQDLTLTFNKFHLLNLAPDPDFLRSLLDFSPLSNLWAVPIGRISDMPTLRAFTEVIDNALGTLQRGCLRSVSIY